MKKYNHYWDAQKLIVNFNQKIWRQDLADFIKKKKYWGPTRVSKVKLVDVERNIKMFQIYDNWNNCVEIKFTNRNDIVFSSTDLTNDYLKEFSKRLYE